MLANDICLDAFGRIQQQVHSAVKGLSQQQLTYQPTKGANSIAWLIWHLTRIQDDHIADLAGHEQVYTAEGWAKKFNLPFPETDTGYGHTDEEVTAVQASAEQLQRYHDAVHAKTTQYIETLKDSDYERIVDEHWDPPVTLAVRLVSIINDDLQHVGQAAYVRGLLQ